MEGKEAVWVVHCGEVVVISVGQGFSWGRWEHSGVGWMLFGVRRLTFKL